MTQSPRAVFLSYASDDAVAACALCEGLRAAGFEVWLDQNELRGGDAWDHRIREQIRQCALFMPVVSRQTQARAEGYFRLEWDLAEQRSRMIARSKAFIVPVCIDDTIEAGAEVPDSFLAVQWTRLPGGAVTAEFIRRIAALLSGPPARGAVAPPDAPSPGDRRSPMRPIVAAIVVIALAVAGPWVWQRVATHGAATSSVASTVAETAAPRPKLEPSVAVLPFVNMSSDREQNYFADGLTEELIDKLAQNRDLKVISRTSSFAFKGQNVDIRRIAEKLGVQNVLEGSVRKDGSDLRVTAQLVRASDGQHLWSQTYDRKLKDIFKVQSEIARTVASTLNVVMNAEVQTEAYAPRSVEAYNLVLKGNYHFRLKNQADTARALDLYQQAIRLEPDYALAWLMVAQALAQQGDNGWAPASEVYPPARAAVDKAVALAPNLVLARMVLGWSRANIDWDFDGARREFERANQLAPGVPRVQRGLAYINHSIYGRLRPEIQLRREELERSPLDLVQLETLAYLLQADGQLEESERDFRELLRVNPSLAGGPAGLAVTLLLMGRHDEALAEAERDVDPRYRDAVLPMIDWALGRKAESDRVLLKAERKYGAANPYLFAQAHAYRNETDAAFQWLDRAYRQRDVALLSIASDPLIRNLRRDPRYAAMLETLHLVEPAH